MDSYIRCFEGVWFGFACEDQKVWASSFGDSEGKVFWNLQEIIRARPSIAADVRSEFARGVFDALKDAYDGKSVGQVQLKMDHLPIYTQKVLKTVAQIPLGYVASYGGVAAAVGGGARAVGNTMANNPFAPLAPCHRVVTSTFGLGGYGGGLRAKYEFLRKERQGFSQPKDIPVGAGVLRVFPVEVVLEKLAETASQNRL
jgi:methylated-DNA-[protein]-cysteine S-methyltransferase